MFTRIVYSNIQRAYFFFFTKFYFYCLMTNRNKFEIYIFYCIGLAVFNLDFIEYNKSAWREQLYTEIFKLMNI